MRTLFDRMTNLNFHQFINMFAFVINVMLLCIQNNSLLINSLMRRLVYSIVHSIYVCVLADDGCFSVGIRMTTIIIQMEGVSFLSLIIIYWWIDYNFPMYIYSIRLHYLGAVESIGLIHDIFSSVIKTPLYYYCCCLWANFGIVIRSALILIFPIFLTMFFVCLAVKQMPKNALVGDRLYCR